MVGDLPPAHTPSTRGEQVATNMVSIVIYMVAVPGSYVYLLFCLVPQHGLDDQVLTNNFGFMWDRFRARCYWWELVDIVRKGIPCGT